MPTGTGSAGAERRRESVLGREKDAIENEKGRETGKKESSEADQGQDHIQGHDPETGQEKGEFFRRFNGTRDLMHKRCLTFVVHLYVKYIYCLWYRPILISIFKHLLIYHHRIKALLQSLLSCTPEP